MANYIAINEPILFYQNVDPKRYLLALHDCLSYIRFDVFDSTQKWETLNVQVFGPERKMLLMIDYLGVIIYKLNKPTNLSNRQAELN